MIDYSCLDIEWLYDRLDFMKRNDWLIFGIALIVAFIWFLLLQIGKKDGSLVEVSIDGNPIAIYSLKENQEMLITGETGGTNLLVIRDGSACVKEATCPDKLCVYQKEIRKANETIVCLPNKVVIRVLGGEDSIYDAVTD